MTRLDQAQYCYGSLVRSLSACQKANEFLLHIRHVDPYIFLFQKTNELLVRIRHIERPYFLFVYVGTTRIA
jgi:hypothetical protein